MLNIGRVIGLPVTIGSVGDVTEAVIREACTGRGGYVCVANVHMVAIAS